MHIKKLNEVAIIISGHSFRQAIIPDNNGNMYVYQAKDVVQDEPFTDPTTLVKISYKNITDDSILQKNDVVIVSRGSKFRSTIYASELNNVIASSSISIIRLNVDNLNPEFVSLFLNSTIGQSAIAEKVTGNYIGALPIKRLGEIKIMLPTLSQQTAIVNLHRNIREQKLIMEHKMDIEQAIINNIFRSNTFIWPPQ